MEEQLISKKDLLEQTDITYGQLYRWKRKNLIPEEWFIRKSTFTGQETFFPKDKIIERVSQIKNLKDTKSLDELANVFSPQTKEIKLLKKEFIEQNIVSSNTIAIFEEQIASLQIIPFQTALNLYLLEKALETGEIGWEEGKQVVQTLNDHSSKLELPAFLIVLRKMGIVTVLLVGSSNNFYVDDKTKVAIHLNIEKVMDELLNKLVIGGF